LDGESSFPAAQESKLSKTDHDFFARGNGLALIGGGQKPVLPDGGLSFLIQSKP
jgi:hypothetical protein